VVVDRLIATASSASVARRTLGEALAQEEGHVAIAVVGGLGKDCEYQLVKRPPVGCHARDAVGLAQAVADAPQARGGGAFPALR
jgi:hypothetical protein